jgi:electron transfer flavoprotein beta subunit
MGAKRIQPVVWKPADIGVEPSKTGAAGRRTKLVKLFQPVREGKCEIVGGGSPEEAGSNLAAKLKEAKVI